MIDLNNGAVCAEPDAVVVAPKGAAPVADQQLPDGLGAVGRPCLRPNIVAGANTGQPQILQNNKVFGALPVKVGQYADDTPSQTPAPQLIEPPRAHGQHRASVINSHLSWSSQEENRDNAVWRIAAQAEAPRASSKARRVAAQLDRVAAHKTWDGTKSKHRKDKVSDADKLSAAVWSAAATHGLAVSLNLGIGREGMLLAHGDPKRRMMQSLSKHLSEVGLGHLSYAMVFEFTPESEGGRLHLHGVIDTTGLDGLDIERMRSALVRAASPAAGAIGGQRQLHLAPLYNRVGWADYLLKSATRTSRELSIDNPFMISKTMSRRAKDTFNALRAQVRERSHHRQEKISAAAATDRNERQGFTVRSISDRRELSGERDKTSAGGVRRPARHQPSHRQRAGRSTVHSPSYPSHHQAVGAVGP